MPAALTIGDFSRATHLSVKTLRHYHGVGLLSPAEVDADTGYRWYTTEQIPTAQVIRRFRNLNMPLDHIRAVLTAPDLRTRNELIAAHLASLEQNLARTQSAVASLRDLLAGPSDSAPVRHRRVGARMTAAVTAVVTMADLPPWYLGALGELHATLGAKGLAATGPAGGIFAGELFTEEYGQATVFVPTETEVPRLGRIESLVVPAAELAVIEHPGSLADVDRAYGRLAAYVADHELHLDGPIREYYLVDRQVTADEKQWRTEVCWPIFSTGATS
ncbi:MerR family transcriptional regulator [Nocardia sp. NEAU-G5]|uniref:MerR family transcriptional regulator n=1 Tax=Nocardia albiluteola TaxID=2842303 RepID=A0ABS6B004_9NOCA|nr:MerR family transcriptional regulator [Nocardia albiluteola]MBU3062593.1 MerR family transcriptional regulator [Nocardia albiluteola]MBU3065573.1 MerR family transcriptional regulator [Nocardia albiluteola]